MTEEIKIIEIDEKSPHLQAVIELGDANRETLGFLPRKAFNNYAKCCQIIVAIDSKESCVGYLLYRVATSYNRVGIIHLCIANSYQGKGVAKKLFGYLVEITQEKYSGIGLTCRRDFNLSNFWSKLGFVFQYDKPAKTPGKTNAYWWFDHRHSNLFSNATTHQREYKLYVGIDSQIFFDFYHSDNNNKDAQSLLADWLDPDLELCLTDEIFNKINVFFDNKDERKHFTNLAKKLFTILSPNKRYSSQYQSLKNLFDQNKINLSESDIRYIDKSITSDVYIFVTGNRGLLDIADKFYEQFNVSIIHPRDLIIQVDEIRRQTEYQPVRLAGTLLQKSRVTLGEEKLLNEYFRADKLGETKAEFQQKILRFIAETDKFDCFLVFEGEKQPLALVVYDRRKKYELEIPLMRVVDTSITATIANHLVFESISISAREERSFTKITDPFLPEAVIRNIHQDGTFVEFNNTYLRANMAVAKTVNQLSQDLEYLAVSLGKEYKFCHQISQLLQKKVENEHEQKELYFNLEKYLWPAKIIDANLPTWIIPIKPFWAKDLFDEELANNWLFGSKTELALKRELVFYRSKRGLKPGVIGRIIWYVSNDEKFPYGTTKVIKACSRLDEVIVDKPEKLYRQFRNLGVYKLEDLIKITKNNPNEDIMAIRFSDTQIFSNVITLKELQDILKKQITVQGLFKITPEQFAKIYDKANKN
ncbi:MAG: GNAT family N-acetyltransferase [Okeania sp. SIO2F4]|uniref:GNAT family N-acetyltransferase n=1 Tax=Okeania sp. SIO2F4 TaxID=2607790 RepID=UPI00142A6158|nr:GNAT family N-acetyltransferase [Okeania sp. SIO2F4]NES03680.1 GNAT family N-acetyltransferase [Okeania sp. SIO2F4]